MAPRDSPPSASHAIEVPFRDITPPPSGSPNRLNPSPDPAPLPSASRSLVPANQPYDSRTADAVRLHAIAKSRAERREQGPHVGNQFVAALDQLYALDPEGSRTANALAMARIETQREALAREQAASRALVVASAPEPEPTWQDEVLASIRRLQEVSGPRKRCHAEDDYEPEAWQGVKPEDIDPRRLVLPRHVQNRYAREGRLDANGEPYTFYGASPSPEPKTETYLTLFGSRHQAEPVRRERLSWLKQMFSAPRKSVWR